MGLPGKCWGSLEQPPLLVARLFFNLVCSVFDSFPRRLGHDQFGALQAFRYIERIAPLDRKLLNLFVGGGRDSLSTPGLA